MRPSEAPWLEGPLESSHYTVLPLLQHRSKGALLAQGLVGLLR